MKAYHIALISLPVMVLAACSGAEEAAPVEDVIVEEPAADGSYDEASAEGQAYRAALECGATMAASSDLLGAISVLVQDEAERATMRENEDAREARADAIKAQAVALGTALGLTEADVEAQFAEHQGTFVQTRESGSMEEFTATVGEQADSCAANYEDAAS